MNKIIHGDALETLKTLESESVQCVVTSPPYWGLRDYGTPGQLGLERTPEEYIAKMVEVFREVRRVMRKDGTLWLNLGDSYAGSWGATSHDLNGKGKRTGYNERPGSSYKQNGLKPKDLCGIPWRLALALQADGFYLRSDIIWAKPNPMPESVTDRPTKAHEYIFLLSKNERYYYDAEAIREDAVADRWGGHKQSPIENSKGDYRGLNRDRDMMPAFRNKRSVWEIATHPYPEAHFATFPEEIPRLCISAGTKEGDTVLDPFSGAGTTCMVAKKLNRQYIGIELNQKYVEMAKLRIETECGTLF